MGITAREPHKWPLYAVRSRYGRKFVAIFSRGLTGKFFPRLVPRPYSFYGYGLWCREPSLFSEDDLRSGR